MSVAAVSHNLLPWMLQTVVVALTAALLPIVFRVRHPRVQLYYCHAALVLCLLLPLMQTVRMLDRPIAAWFPPTWLLYAFAAGILLQLGWMSFGLWRIRRYRIAATPLYPIPEAMQAASAVTHADALFCISEQASSPMMLGWLAPVVLLPSTFLTLDEEAQCGIACHELLHVKRGDWLVALLEEFARALFWFNPGVRLLLSEARLARELLVDAESVRLTASREPYIDALMTIARGRAWSDLAPAPSFLRRSHLTQRMQSLLSDAPSSALRVAGSYCSIVAFVACSVWLASTAFPLLGEPGTPASPVTAFRQNTPTPAPQPAPLVAAAPQITTPAPNRTLSAPPVLDPNEPVTGGIQLAATPGDRAMALSPFFRAQQMSVRHGSGMPPFRFIASFTAAGNVLDTGQGELTETWMSGQKWRWTATLGGFSHVRLAYHGQLLEDRHATVIPMRAHMLRFEILWGIRGIPNDAAVRTAAITWRSQPTTCTLISEAPASDPDQLQTQSRLWDEEEYCFENASGALVIHSIAPGTYTHFDYGAHQTFHGWPMPDRITTYAAGALATDASFRIEDTDAADEALLVPAPGMTGDPKPVQLGNYFHQRINAVGSVSADPSQPVIIHSEIDSDGNVVEAELTATSNAALATAALDVVRKMQFGHSGTERHAFIDFRFIPASTSR